MRTSRTQSNLFSKSLLLPLLVCAGLGVCGLYTAARADDKQDQKTETRTFTVVVDDAKTPQGDTKLSDEERKKLHAELDSLSQERKKLDEKIATLRGKLGERMQTFAFVNGKKIDLSADARALTLTNPDDKNAYLFLKDDGKIVADDNLSIKVDGLPKGGERSLRLFYKKDVAPGDMKDLNIDLGVLKDLAQERNWKFEDLIAGEDKEPQLLHGQKITILRDKAPGGSVKVHVLRSDSDSRIQALEKRIEALEKLLKAKAEADKK